MTHWIGGELNSNSIIYFFGLLNLEKVNGLQVDAIFLKTKYILNLNLCRMK